MAAAVLVLGLSVSLPAGEAARREIDRTLAEVLGRPEFQSSTFGVSFARVKTGEVIFEHGSRRLLAPASNTKIVSTAGALAALGKDYQFDTRIVAGGAVKDGVLLGDLVLVAVGDFNLSQRIGPGGRLLFKDKDHSYAGFYEAGVVPGDPLAVIKDLAEQVHRAGVRQVRGDIVVDDGFFEETEDEFVGVFSAVCVNDNLLDVTVEPGQREGAPARYSYEPRGSIVRVESSATTVAEGRPAEVWIESLDETASFRLGGSIPLGSKPILRTASFRRPALAAASFLADELRRLGVGIEGKERQATQGPTAYETRPVLALHRSPPLSEAIRVILKVSHNLHATMLPVLLGALKGGRADRRSGYKVIHDLFQSQGIDMGAIVLQSGSGGGRADSISAGWMTDFLVHLARREDFPVFLDALPIGGHDGTLESAFKDPVFEKRVRAKTGTLVYRGSLNDRWVYLSKSLSGYIDLDRPDDRLAFSIIIANTICEGRKKGADDLFRAQEDIVRAAMEAVRAESAPADTEGEERSRRRITTETRKHRGEKKGEERKGGGGGTGGGAGEGAGKSQPPTDTDRTPTR